MIFTLTEAYQLLYSLGAPDKLITHVKLVGEAAEYLITKLEAIQFDFNSQLVRLAVAFHDTGKIAYPNELDGPGALHEPAGQKMLLEAGVQAEIARCCMSYARYNQMVCSLEELLVALCDKLWKGKRVNELELQVIDRIAKRLGRSRWELFTELDGFFEQIAAAGSERLNRSR